MFFPRELSYLEALLTKVKIAKQLSVTVANDLDKFNLP